MPADEDEGRKRDDPYPSTVCIVLLGDVGRSPRMRYHAESLVEEGFVVHFICYSSTPPPVSMSENPSIWIHSMTEPPTFLQRLPPLLSYPLKIAFQLLTLTFAFVWMLLRYQFWPDFILMQNPPAIPCLPLCYAMSKVLFADLIIDWHNYAYSIMALNHGVKHPIVKIARRVEEFFGRRADRNLCVTKAMKDDLKEKGVSAVVLYDRPPSRFHSFSPSEVKSFRRKLTKDYPDLEGRGIVVSSTSWTEDEDFKILLNALKDYDVACNNYKVLPKLMVFITGKGPLKQFYTDLIPTMNYKNVQVQLPWLDHEDYPRLLASASLGVSLHYSSSGLDLPMKVVDMFGCGIPVCAISFKCLSELVRHNENGFIFKDSVELSGQIQTWFKMADKEHNRFHEELKKFQSLRWHENWQLNALPLFK